MLKDEKKIMTIESIIDYLTFTKIYKHLYFNYILDRRTRIYIKNVPINPQLEKTLRPVLIPEEGCDLKESYKIFIKNICKKYETSEVFSVLLYLEPIKKIFKNKILILEERLDEICLEEVKE
jgi:hypothetical protein